MALYSAIAAKYPDLIEISGKYINEAGLCTLGMINGSALTSVVFESVAATNHGIYMLCKGNSNLKTLTLPSLSGFGVTDESVSSIVKYCPGIERLSLPEWNNISDIALDLLSMLPCLMDIRLSNCTGLTSAGIMTLLRRIGSQLEVLQPCDLSVIQPQKCTYCNDALLQCIGECCPNLRVFVVDTWFNVITEATFTTMFQGCPLLETLVCSYLPDVALIQLAKHCPCLDT